jgi:hypothetical protein
MSEWSHGDVSDIDGKTESLKWAGAHESMWEWSEFQSLLSRVRLFLITRHDE